MWCFAVSVGAVHNDSTVSVVSFDIAGTLKQKVEVELQASAAPPPKRQFDESTLDDGRLLTRLSYRSLKNH